ncbi:hypothetical protein MBLNU230_g7417t1 [Neophaeotheca triangularis]
MSKSAGRAGRPQVRNLLRLIYEPTPRPINCTTFEATKSFLEDDTHPLHKKTKRRLAAFDPKELHWRVHVPVDATKRVIIRRWAKRRVAAAFTKQLQKTGFNENGSILDRRLTTTRLSGAALILLPKDDSILTTSRSDIEESCRALLENLRRKAPTKYQPHIASETERDVKNDKVFGLGSTSDKKFVPQGSGPEG